MVFPKEGWVVLSKPALETPDWLIFRVMVRAP